MYLDALNLAMSDICFLGCLNVFLNESAVNGRLVLTMPVAFKKTELSLTEYPFFESLSYNVNLHIMHLGQKAAAVI